jgi:hypothetical protein
MSVVCLWVETHPAFIINNLHEYVLNKVIVDWTLQYCIPVHVLKHQKQLQDYMLAAHHQYTKWQPQCCQMPREKNKIITRRSAQTYSSCIMT